MQILEAAIVPAQRAYGILYHQFIDNVPFVIRIFGKPMMKYFRLTGTYPLEKTVGRPVTLKDCKFKLISEKSFNFFKKSWTSAPVSVT